MGNRVVAMQLDQGAATLRNLENLCVELELGIMWVRDQKSERDPRQRSFGPSVITPGADSKYTTRRTQQCNCIGL